MAYPSYSRGGSDGPATRAARERGPGATSPAAQHTRRRALSNRKHTLRASAFALTGAAPAVVPLAAMTPAAQAVVAPKSPAARTLPHSRLDSAGNGYWAYDHFTPALALTYPGQSAGRARGEGST